MKVCRSFTLFGIRPFTGKDVEDDGKIKVEEVDIDMMKDEMIKKGTRSRQRIFGSGKYLGQNKPRFDTVILRGEMEEEDENVTNIWFGKVLAILEITKHGVIRPGTTNCAMHNQSDCEACGKNDRNRFVFVQYSDVFPPSVVPVDAIESVLNCVRLV